MILVDNVIISYLYKETYKNNGKNMCYFYELFYIINVVRLFTKKLIRIFPQKTVSNPTQIILVYLKERGENVFEKKP